MSAPFYVPLVYSFWYVPFYVPLGHTPFGSGIGFYET